MIALVLLMKANQSESEWTIQVHTTARSLIFGIQFKYIYIFKQRIVAASFCSDTKHLTKIIPTDLKKKQHVLETFVLKWMGKVLKTMECFLPACCDIIRAATNKIKCGIIFNNQPGHNCIFCWNLPLKKIQKSDQNRF